ncbi:MAG: thiamine-phosphate kinase [Pyrinomonadaceae bacterium]
MTSEFDFIERICRQTLVRKRRPVGLTRGIGDDAAIIKQHAEDETLITADLLVEDVDFRREWMPPRLLGHKALAVSLSDIAAMGARPRFALLSIGVPHSIFRTTFLDEFYAGFFALADYYKIALIGGDVSRTPDRIVVDSIVIGEAKRGHSITRAGARPGDKIFVTGTLGGASGGLRLLMKGARLTKKSASQRSSSLNDLLLRQLRPEPRVAWGVQLGIKKLASAMIDVSDGLSSDLAHLCEESGVGADVQAARIPFDPLVMQVYGQSAASPSPIDLALNGGEDYELLFTVRPRDVVRLPKRLNGVQIAQIGVITKQRRRIRLMENSRARELKPCGFAHFR